MYPLILYLPCLFTLISTCAFTDATPVAAVAASVVIVNIVVDYNDKCYRYCVVDEKNCR